MIRHEVTSRAPRRTVYRDAFGRSGERGEPNGRRCVECGSALRGRERKYDPECAELVRETRRVGA